MEVLAIIPARGGSKGIRNKNMTLLNGCPLLKYTFDAAKGSKLVSRTILSTDSDEYARYACLNQIEVRMRPPELAKDDTLMKSVIDYHLEELKNEGYEPDVFVLLQPTSPLRTSKHIDESLHELFQNEFADSLVSVIKVPHNCIPQKIMVLEEGFLHFYMEDGEQYSTRQELPVYFARNGAAIYAVYTKTYLNTRSLYGKNCIPYEMEEIESIDIDEINDLKLAEYLLSINNK